jgi:hypothetical protein
MEEGEGRSCDRKSRIGLDRYYSTGVTGFLASYISKCSTSPPDSGSWRRAKIKGLGRRMASTLVIIGLVSIMAAIIGGGLSALGVTIPTVESIGRQITLGIFGIIVLAAGAFASGGISATIENLFPTTPTPTPTPTPSPLPTASPSPVVSPSPTPSPLPTASPSPVVSPSPAVSPKPLDLTFPALLHWVALDDLSRRFKKTSKIDTYIDGTLVSTFYFSQRPGDDFDKDVHINLMPGLHRFKFIPDIVSSTDIPITTGCGGSFRVTEDADLIRSVDVNFFNTTGNIANCSINIR